MGTALPCPGRVSWKSKWLKSNSIEITPNTPTIDSSTCTVHRVCAKHKAVCLRNCPAMLQESHTSPLLRRRRHSVPTSYQLIHHQPVGCHLRDPRWPQGVPAGTDEYQYHDDSMPCSMRWVNSS